MQFEAIATSWEGCDMLYGCAMLGLLTTTSAASKDVIRSRRIDGYDLIGGFYLGVGKRIKSCLIQTLTDLVTRIKDGANIDRTTQLRQ